MTIGQRLREIRLKCGLTQCEAAKRASLTPVYLCFLERGRNDPSVKVMRRLAKVYGTTIQAIVTE